MTNEKNSVLAYVIGCALGDGNLSSPNGRVTRLRITCDAQYPQLAQEIASALRLLLPENRVSFVQRESDNCLDISVYSKKLDGWMPWQVGKGTKIAQQARVPAWIREDPAHMQHCLRGLLQTDGCFYTDRGYKMVNFVSNGRLLAENVRDMLGELGYYPRLNLLGLASGGCKYTVKVVRKAQVERLHKDLRLYKA